MLAALLLFATACDKVDRNPVPVTPAATLPGNISLKPTRLKAGEALLIKLEDSVSLSAGLSVDFLIPVYGKMTYNLAANTYTYSPYTGFSGTETLQFRVCNSINCSIISLDVQVAALPEDTNVYCSYRLLPKQLRFEKPDTLSVELIDLKTDSLCLPINRYKIEIVGTLPAGIQKAELNGMSLKVYMDHIPDTPLQTISYQLMLDGYKVSESHLDIYSPTCAGYFSPVNDTVDAVIDSVSGSPASTTVVSAEILISDLLKNDISCSNDLDAASFALESWDNEAKIISIEYKNNRKILSVKAVHEPGTVPKDLVYKVRSKSANAFKTAKITLRLP